MQYEANGIKFKGRNRGEEEGERGGEPQLAQENKTQTEPAYCRAIARHDITRGVGISKQLTEKVFNNLAKSNNHLEVRGC